MATTLSPTSSWLLNHPSASIGQPPRNQPAMRRSMMGSLKGKLGMVNNNTDKPTSPLKSPVGGMNSMPPQAPVQNDALFATAPPTRRPDRAGMNAFTTLSNEPPPAYTPDSNVSPMVQSIVNAPVQSQTAGSTADDPYSFLGTFDTVFLIDDSGSMAGRSWRECSQALAAITPICTAHDSDGIDILFLNTPPQPYHCNVTTSSTIHEIFSTVRPGGGTPTGQRLNSILKPYLRDLETKPEGMVKPMNIIVITDGVPSDDVESVLISAAKKLDKLDAVAWQVGVQFMQVGEEQGAGEHLMGLDDELSRMGGGCRDIVDTVPMAHGAALTAEGILKTVLGAVNRRLDRRVNNPA